MYRISVCDDNESELEKICGTVREYIDINNISAEINRFSSGEQMLLAEECGQHSDIYILDIIMPHMNGIELGQAVRRIVPGAYIIYLTSSKDYALESYSVKAFSYLLKPVEKNRITAELADCFSRISRAPRRFALKCVTGTTTVSVSDIIYIEYYNHRMKYRLAGGNTLESVYFRGTFDSMIEEYIKNGCFIKSSASYLVNMDHIRAVNTGGFVMSDGTKLTVTRKYSQARKQYIDYALSGGESSDDL